MPADRVEPIHGGRHTLSMSDGTTDNLDENNATPPSPPTPEQRAAENRATQIKLGLAAFACLILGVALLFTTPNTEIAAAFIRVGVLAAATWLAFPTLSKIRWRPKNQFETAIVYLLLVLMAIRPKVFVPISFALAILMLFKIPTGKKPSDGDSA